MYFTRNKMKLLQQHYSPLRIQFSQFNHNSPTILDHNLYDDVPLSRHRHENAKSISLEVSNCTSLKYLRQLLAHILRTHFLHLYPHSFHYNNISRIYTRLGSPREALHVYIAMRRAGISPDNFTLPIVLKAANQILDRVLGEQAHCVSIRHGLDSDIYCESGLISLYSKAGQFGSACKVFVESPERKLGSWNAIISGLSQGGRGKEALHMFVEMMRSGVSPDNVTMVSVTSACGSLGDLNLALQLHKFVFQVEKSDILMMNSVIDTYGKCGRMDLAHKVFCEMEFKNVSSWTSMIVGYAAHGHANDALVCFSHMRSTGITPNHVTFVGVLSACVHGGMVQEGKHYFKMMTEGYGIKATLPHYGCMVDLLGRAELLDEAKVMVERMPMKANVVVWGCLMGACEKYGDVEMGEWVAKELVEMEPGNDGVFVVLSNIYASRGMWKEVERLREVMKDRKLAKLPAYSLPH